MISLRLLAFGLTLLAASSAASSIEIRRDRLYATSTNPSAIREYSTAGVELSSQSIPGLTSEPRGLAIGPKDGLLYVVTATFTTTTPPRVDIRGRTGALIRSIPFDGSMIGNSSYGSIAMHPSGSVFYVTSSVGVHQFLSPFTTGTLLIPTLAFDIDILPNGDLLVVTPSSVNRYDPSGMLLGSFTAIDDPDQLLSPTPQNLSFARGVAYAPSVDRTFVTMLGFMPDNGTVLAFEGLTNRLVARAVYDRSTDLQITPDNRLLVGSFVNEPGIYNFNLVLTGLFQGQGGGFGVQAGFLAPYTVTRFFVSGFEGGE